MTPQEIATIVPKYYRAWADADRTFVDTMIGDPFVFTSPYDDHIDRAEYFRRCWPNAGGQESGFDLIAVLPDGNNGALVLYQAKMKQGGMIRNAEHLRFRDGKLASVDVYFGLARGECPTTPDAWRVGQEQARMRATHADPASKETMEWLI